MVANGRHVVALARKAHAGTTLSLTDLNADLTFVGLVGIAPG